MGDIIEELKQQILERICEIKSNQNNSESTKKFSKEDIKNKFNFIETQIPSFDKNFTNLNNAKNSTINFYRNTVNLKKELKKFQNRYPDFKDVIDYLITYTELSEQRKDKAFKFPNIVLVGDDIFYINKFIHELSNLIFYDSVTLEKSDFIKTETSSYNFENKIDKKPRNQLININILDSILNEEKIKEMFNGFHQFYMVNNSTIYDDKHQEYNLIYSLSLETLKHCNFLDKINEQEIETSKELQDPKKNLLTKILKDYLQEIYNENYNIHLNDDYLLPFANKKVFVIKRKNINTILNEIYKKTFIDIFDVDEDKVYTLTQDDCHKFNIVFETVIDMESKIKFYLADAFNDYQSKIIDHQKIIDKIIKSSSNYYLLRLEQSIKNLNNSTTNKLLNKEKETLVFLECEVSNIAYNVALLLETKDFFKISLNIKLPEDLKSILIEQKDGFNQLIKENFIKIFYEEETTDMVQKATPLLFDWLITNSKEIFKINPSVEICSFEKLHKPDEYLNEIIYIDKDEKVKCRSIKNIEKILVSMKKEFPDFNQFIDYLIKYVNLNRLSRSKLFNFPDTAIVCEDLSYIKYFIKKLEQKIYNKVTIFNMDDFKKYNTWEYEYERYKMDTIKNSIVSLNFMQDFFNKRKFEKEGFNDFLKNKNTVCKLTKNNHMFNLIYPINYKILERNCAQYYLFEHFEKDIQTPQKNILTTILQKFIQDQKDDIYSSYLTNNESFLTDKKIFLIKNKNITKIINNIYNEIFNTFFQFNNNKNIFTQNDCEKLKICFGTIENIEQALKKYINFIYNNYEQTELFDNNNNNNNIVDKIIDISHKTNLFKINQSIINLNNYNKEDSKDVILNEKVSNEIANIIENINWQISKDELFNMRLSQSLNISLTKDEIKVKEFIKNALIKNKKLQNKEFDNLTNLFFNWLIKNKLTFFEVIKIENNIEDKKDYNEKKILNNFRTFASNYDESNEILKKYLEILKNDNGMRKIKLLNDDFTKKIALLREEFPNFSEYIDFLEQELHIKKITNQEFSLSPSLLIGPAGIGKTYFIIKLAEYFNVKFYNCNLSSVESSATLTGNSPTWGNSRPGIIFDNCVNNEYVNNILLLDEIDKAESYISNTANIQNTLLNVLEKETAKQFKDQFVDLEINANVINFIATANDMNNISEPIQSRLRIFEIKAPTKKEMEIICSKIYKNLLKDLELTNLFVNDIDEQNISKLINKELSCREIKNIIHNCIGRVVVDNHKENGLFKITNECIDFHIIKNRKNIGFK